MKKLTTLIIILIGFAFSQEWTVLTRDNEVSNRDMVEVEQSLTKVEKQSYTINGINNQLQSLSMRLIRYAEQAENVQAKIDELEVIKVELESRVDMVQLKGG